MELERRHRQQQRDNLRPVLAAGAGRRALVWMRGRYPTYQFFDTEVIVRRLA
ncbi:hypothetical protein KSP35_15290 [Aquihabitans sp. G128]|uniref:hypothetical protein n=1 Tax=Aquihabitans sp. G128 TaxID=2849779 RepID=UPI001C21AB46|nr:hypothetical protein [Aquihabitans sp. G128]QXC59736.1 hypothetical protein KSP35_15290 [Aquihabitans sp. G128]